MKKKSGFSLIEIIVVVSVMGFILTSITTVLVNSFKAKNKISLADKVEQNGSWILSEIRKNVVNISGDRIGYDPLDKSFLTLTKEGIETTIRCSNDKIASESANPARLSSDDVVVSGCGNFITTTTSPAMGNVTTLNIGFSLSAGRVEGGPTDYVSKYFTSEIRIRN
jgi:prepilin-type N-terminal cleavage/methylation domain-containing protein